MRNEQRPECRWVAVVDADGRRRLEMQWQLPVVATALPVAPRPVAVRPQVARAA